MASVALLQEIIRSNSVKKAIHQNLYIGNYNINKLKTYSSLIDINNTKIDNLPKCDFRKKLFSYDEYKKYLAQIFKEEKDDGVTNNGVDN